MKPSFTAPPNPEAFNSLVWEIVRKIPRGRVSTYGQIAAMISPAEGRHLPDFQSFGARWVGGAMAACPEGIPWQRVINGRGRISLRPGDGPALQRRLLEEEGISFESGDRIEFDRYGWIGPDESWLLKKGLKKPPSLARPFKAEFKF